MVVTHRDSRAPALTGSPVETIMARNRPIMQIRAITNQKGGVGKTTTSVNLGAALAELGQRVLVIDLDPQGNLSTHVGLSIHELEKTMYDVLTQGTPMRDALQETGVPGLYCIPSNIDLSGAEVEIVATVGRETLLKEAIESLNESMDQPFDHVLIDCPPSLGLLCINALAAAQEVLVPMQTEFFALQGMGKLLEVMDIVQKRINPSLSLGGIVACRVDPRTRLTTEVLDDIRSHFPELLFQTRIRQNIKLAEAPSFGKTIVEYDTESNGAEDYRRLAREFLGQQGAPAIEAADDPVAIETEAETEIDSVDDGVTEAANNSTAQAAAQSDA